MSLKNLYPLTITKDRYGGAYSGGGWLAFHLHPWEVKDNEAFGSDTACAYFWDDDHIIGVGKTPEEAVDNLKEKIINNVKQQRKT